MTKAREIAELGQNLTVDASGNAEFSGDIELGDNNKVIFGAGSDLQIYHDTSASYISDQGAGPLNVLGSQINMYNAAEDTQFASWNSSAVKTYIGGSLITNTTATGVDITGTLTSDGLTVDGVIEVNTARPQIFLYENDRVGNNTRLESSFDDFNIAQVDDANSSPVNRLSIEMDTGDLSLYDSTGTTPKFFWDASAESLGIGTSSPDDVFHVVTPSFGGITLECTGATADPTFKFLGDSGNYWSLQQDASQGDSFQFRYNNSEKIRIESGGDIGINTAPSSIGTNITTLHIKGGATDRSGGLFLTTSDESQKYFQALSGGAFISAVTTNHPYVFRTNNTERMRIDSSGNLLVNTTSPSSPDNGNGGTVFDLGSFGRAVLELGHTDTSTTQRTMINFYSGSGSGRVGAVTCNNTATTYSTSSDYRLKTDAQPMTGASARVQALKPVNFEWIADGTRVDGFLAHEAQEVVPEAVTGTKDAMRDQEYEVTPAVYEDVVIPAVLDDDGNELEAERTEQRLVTEAVMGTRSVPDYQGIDQSKLVPLLTAALQEALTKIDDMETRLAALEAV